VSKGWVQKASIPLPPPPPPPLLLLLLLLAPAAAAAHKFQLNGPLPLPTNH
jgi:hypothetical protein